MQLKDFSEEFNKVRWTSDMFVGMATAICTPFLIRILTFPMTSSPVTITTVLTEVGGVGLAYLWSFALGIWVVRIRSRSFLWVGVVGSLSYAVLRIVVALPGSIEYHRNFVTDSSLAAYVSAQPVPLFSPPPLAKFLQFSSLGDFHSSTSNSVDYINAIIALRQLLPKIYFRGITTKRMRTANEVESNQNTRLAIVLTQYAFQSVQDPRRDGPLVENHLDVD